MKITGLIIVLTLTFASRSWAQTDSSITLPENTIFTEHSKVGFNRDAAFFNNVIKIEPTMLLRNTVFAGYDRYINNNFAVSAGAGYCFGFDPLLVVNPTINVLTNIDPNSEYFSFNDLVSVRKKFKTGFSFQLAARRYFEKDDYFPGGYAELSYRFSHFQYSFTDEDFLNSTGYTIKNNQPVNLGTSAMTISYGYQIHTRGKIKTVHDFAFGVGYRIAAINEITKNNRSINSQTGTLLPKESTMYNNKVFFGGYMINVGYTFGFGF